MKRSRPKNESNVPDVPGRTSGHDGDASASRRHILRWMWGGLLAALSVEFGLIVASFFRPRRGRTDGQTALFVAGPVERFAPDSVTAFPDGGFYLARLETGAFLALDRTCTHLGCAVPWDAEQHCFQCPCHASSFDIAGAVLTPPAPRPLEHYPVRIENGIVKVDTHQRIRRTEYLESQGVHA